MSPEPHSVVSFSDVLGIVGVLLGMLASIIGVLIGVVYKKVADELKQCNEELDELESIVQRLTASIAQYQQIQTHAGQDVDRILVDVKALVNWKIRIEVEHEMCFKHLRDLRDKSN